MGCSEKKGNCECPEKVRGKPEECTLTQIKKCHGTTAKHPCIPKKGGKK